MAGEQPALIEIPPSARPTVSERHVQAVAVALRQQWGPCDAYHDGDECDGMCHVSMVRAVLECSAALGAPPPADALRRAVEQAWLVACSYGELTDRLTPHMALSKAHVETVVHRIAPILRGSDASRVESQGGDHG